MHEQREADVGTPISYFIAISSERHGEEKADRPSYSLKGAEQSAAEFREQLGARWRSRSNDEIKRTTQG